MESVKIALMEHMPILQQELVFLVLPPAQTALAVVIVQDAILAIIFMHINAYQMFQYVR